MSKYDWLKNEVPLPKTILEGLKELGTVETAGAGNTPKIMKWAAEVGLSSTYSADSIPWCGLFAAVVVKRAGKQVVGSPLWAKSWANFGVAVAKPGLGDILVFSRKGGGHVGFYVAEDATAYHVLGGNQSDSVSITRIAKNRLFAARRPNYTNKPASVKPFIVSGTGALSTNES